MIKITQIDEELNIFKQNTVIICGADKNALKMLELLEYHKIKVFAFLDITNNLKDFVYNAIPVITINELEKLAQIGHSLILQESPYMSEWEHIKSSTKHLNIKSYIQIRETWHILLFKQRRELYLRNPKIVIEDDSLQDALIVTRREELRQYVEVAFGKPVNVLCLPTKTGDHTLMHTLNASGISYFQLWHSPKSFDRVLFNSVTNKIRIIFAVRDPIAHNISLVYQKVSRGLCDDLPLYKTLIAEKESFFKDGGDAQTLFDMWLEHSEYMNVQRKERPDHWDIQGVALQFIKYICDFTQYEFDRRKGYCVIKEGNIEIFIYQLEKLNDLKLELSQFLEASIPAFVMSNLASDKWVNKSYQSAKRELKISREYFDKCYKEEYVQHCYSSEDIEKFKSRWKNNIKS